MIYTNLRMPVPQGPRYETINVHGIPYLYYRKESRRINGHLKHFRQSLGRTVCEDDGLYLIPNENYFSHMGLPQPAGEEIRKPGRQRKKSDDSACSGTAGSTSAYAIACNQISRELGLADDLAKVFGEKRARDMLAVAAYMARGAAGGMGGLEYFMQKQGHFADRELSFQKLGTVYHDITAAERDGFFSLWARRHGTDDIVCYDVTSSSVCPDSVPAAAYGCNRDMERLAQVNHGLFCSVSGGLPLCYTEYNGNLTDFTNLSDVTKCAKEYGINNKFLIVIDEYFAIQSDTELAKLDGYDFLMGVPACFSSNINRVLLDWRMKSNEAEKIIEYNDELFRTADINYTFKDKAVRVLLYKSSSKTSDEECSLARLKKAANDCFDNLHGKIPASEAEKYDRFFNEASWRESVELCGCFALLCTKEDLSLYDALCLYREKDEAKKTFGMLKNDILPERLHVAEAKSLQGKTFLAFLSLILRRHFSGRLKHWLLQKDLSLSAALEMLCDTECQKHKSDWILTRAFTARQKELIKVLDLPVNYL